jgi:hypothetical protein
LGSVTFVFEVLALFIAISFDFSFVVKESWYFSTSIILS